MAQETPQQTEMQIIPSQIRPWNRNLFFLHLPRAAQTWHSQRGFVLSWDPRADEAPWTLSSQDQAGGSFQLFLGRKTLIRNVFVPWGHRGATLSRQLLLTEPWDTFKGMSSSGSAFPPSWILPGTCCSLNISSVYPEHGFTAECYALWENQRVGPAKMG